MADEARVLWQDKYAFVPVTGSIGASCGFATGSGIGVGTDKFGLPLNNHPHLDAGLDIYDQEKAIGLAERSVATGHCEFLQGTKNPMSTWEFDGNAYNLASFLWTLFQKGTTEGTGTGGSGTGIYTKTYNPPTATEGPECEVWMNLLRKMDEGTSTQSHRGVGFIVKSITLSASGFGPLNVSAELVGADIDYTWNAASALMDFGSNCGVVWGGASGASCEIGGHAAELEGFEITITNNAIARHYGGQDVEKFILGRYSVEGSITVFWGDDETNIGKNNQIDNFIDGTDQLLEIWWGTQGGKTAAGDLDIKVNMRYTGAEMTDNDTELAWDLPFIGVYDGTNHAVEITLADGIDRSIP